MKIESIIYRYVECTSAAIQGLALFTQQYPRHRKMEIEICIAKAAKYIESMQLADGSWFALLLVHKLNYSTKGVSKMMLIS
jgi:squalene cyclase